MPITSWLSSFTLERMALGTDRASSVVGNGVTRPSGAAADWERNVDIAFVGRLIDEKRADLIVEAVGRPATGAAPSAA